MKFIMKKIKSKVEKIDIVLIIIILILIIITLIVFFKKEIQPTEQNTYQLSTVVKEENKNEQPQVPKTNEELIKHLSTLGERDRMEYYCGVYFKHIEKKQYESAYNLLYPEFKQNYFPTLEQYIEYIEKTYPKYWALNYDDITRQGNIYVIRLQVLDVLGSKEDEKVQRIVVRENNFNEFDMSFQVI